MDDPHLQLRQQLPESGGSFVRFAPERYYRDPREIENSIHLQEKELEKAELALTDMRRQDEARQIDHDRKYGWFFGYKCMRFLKVGGCCCVVGIIIGTLVTWIVISNGTTY